MGMPVVVVSSGGLPVTEVASGFGLPVSVVSNGFGIAVTIVSSGGMPVVGSGAVPSAPVLSLISTTGSAVSLAIDIDNTIGAGDTVTLQAQISGGNWTSLLVNTNHTITSGEDGANEVDLTPAGFANGVYDFRASVTSATSGLTSPWSNTLSVTISNAYVPTYYILGF
jgi:hypothetical protein